MNRFSPIVPSAQFSPLTYQEVMEPAAIQRAAIDSTLNQMDQISAMYNNITVPDIYQEDVNQERQAFSQELDGLTDLINKQGAANLSTQGKFRDLRNKFNKTMSASGATGQAMRINQELAIKEEEFKKLAYQQGWGKDPKTIEDAWAQQRDAYLRELPEYSKLQDGNIKAFNLEHLPAHMDLRTVLEEYAGYIGQIGTDIDNLEMQINPDGTTQAIITNEQTLSNGTNLRRFVNFINTTVLDDKSQLGQVLKAKKITPKDFTEMAEQFAGVMEKTSVSSKIRSGGGGKSGTKKPKSTSNSSHWMVQESEFMPYKNSHSIASIQDEMKKINADDSLLEEDKNAQLSMLQSLEINRENYMGTPEYREALADNFNQIKETLNENLARFSGLDLQINSVEQLEQLLNDPEFLNSELNSKPKREVTLARQGSSFVTSPNAPIDLLKEAYRQIDDKVNTPSHYLTQVMSLAPVDQNSEYHKQLNSTLNTVEQGEYLINNNLISARLSPEEIDQQKNVVNYLGKRMWQGNTNFTKEKNEEATKKLHEMIRLGTDTKFNIYGFDSGNLTTNPKILLSVEGKLEDKTKKVFAQINLTDDAFTRSLLKDPNSVLLKNASAEERIKFNRMYTNIVLRGTPTDREQAFKDRPIYNPQDTQLIRNKTSRNLNSVKSTYAKTKDGQFISTNNWNNMPEEYRFFKSKDDNSDYSVRKTKQDDYMLSKRDRNSNQETFLSFKDHKLANMLAIYRGSKKVNASKIPDVDFNYYESLYVGSFTDPFLGVDPTDATTLRNTSKVYSSSPDYTSDVKKLQEVYLGNLLSDRSGIDFTKPAVQNATKNFLKKYNSSPVISRDLSRILQ